ncbi:MAG: SMI1/KNR4 family protein [Bacteroidia bacterium]|nr:SMI1/KNR4 family protein [Bacteroidia bacterium]
MKTSNYRLEIENIIRELKKFSDNILTLNPPINPELIIKFEKKYQLELPNDYKYLLSQSNGINLMGDEVLGITFSDYGYDLASTYEFEHFDNQIHQFDYLIPFSPDGGGNFYCFDIRKKTNDDDSCKIVFWYSNYEYSETDEPEITHDNLSNFINECIIGWTLEDYDYDGNRKITSNEGKVPKRG